MKMGVRRTLQVVGIHLLTVRAEAIAGRLMGRSTSPYIDLAHVDCLAARTRKGPYPRVLEFLKWKPHLSQLTRLGDRPCGLGCRPGSIDNVEADLARPPALMRGA